MNCWEAVILHKGPFLYQTTLCNESDITEGPRKERGANKVSTLGITACGKAIRGDLGLCLEQKVQPPMKLLP